MREPFWWPMVEPPLRVDRGLVAWSWPFPEPMVDPAQDLVYLPREGVA